VKKKTGGVDWDGVFKGLKAWQAKLSVEQPSVSTVAERYRHDPWAVLVSTILSLRTKDEVTLESSRRLLEPAGSPEKLLSMEPAQIEELIYPAGFYRTKAASLKKIAEILLAHYGGRVPDDMESLLALPGVGRKTANLVLIEAFDKPGLCVDIHVHRISNRAGWLSTKTPDKTEEVLREILPVKYWKSINALLVLYGQHLCRPLSPYCSVCEIKPHCQRQGVTRSR